MKAGIFQRPRHALRRLARRVQRWRSAWRRWSLWVLLIALVASMLVTLVWLAGRQEASEVQQRLERDNADALADIRNAFAHNLQNLQALQAHEPDPLSWELRAADLLNTRRELARIEWRDAQLRVRAQVHSPFRPMLSEALQQRGSFSEITLACSNAQRINAPSYSGSYFQPVPGGGGAEMLEICIPLYHSGRLTGYVTATYSLQAVLADLVAPGLTRSQEASFTETDGTRLALIAAARRGTRLFSSQQLLDLPGYTLMLRLDGWHSPPSVLPNVLTAMVTAMSIALVSVLVVLVRDNRRRLRAESELGDALAFRKAMEDSLVIGLRAYDLTGRISYVNPAFCAMVGFAPEDLLGHTTPSYWPPELAQDYLARQEARRLGLHHPHTDGHESIFLRSDGTRFPVRIYEAPLIDARGRHSGWMGSVLDLSAQRRAEALSRTSQERLQASARLATMGEMASLLSHELNQPLAAIASYASGSLNLLEADDTACDPPATADDLRLALTRISEQAERAGRVIKSVHDFVRRRAQVREHVSAQQLLDSVLPLVRLHAAPLGVRVLLEVQAPLPEVLCDRTMVEQVLLNLARNAIQAMDNPEIHARELRLAVHLAPSAAARRWLTFRIVDLGLGIDDEVARQLFTPLFTTRAEGMGLGLSLCRTVIEQHGGQLTHAPHQPRGTVFTFTLPAA